MKESNVVSLNSNGLADVISNITELYHSGKLRNLLVCAAYSSEEAPLDDVIFLAAGEHDTWKNVGMLEVFKTSIIDSDLRTGV